MTDNFDAQVGFVDCDVQEPDTIDLILQRCLKIKTYRDEQSVFTHLSSEVVELNHELDKKYFGTRPGADGVFGECVDIIL